MLKILQTRLQQYVNGELPDVEAGFRKGRGTRDQIANICWIMKKARSSRKTSTSALSTTSNPLTAWITTAEMNNSQNIFLFILFAQLLYYLKFFFKFFKILLFIIIIIAFLWDWTEN